MQPSGKVPDIQNDTLYPMTDTNLSELDFEQSISQLETIVEQMEQGDLPLETALEKFELGIKLVRHSSEKLKHAEQRVQMLLAKDGTETLVDLPTSRGDE